MACALNGIGLRKRHYGALISVWFLLLTAIASLFTPTAAAQGSYDEAARFAFTASNSKHEIYIIDLYDRSLASTISFTRPIDDLSASENMKALIVAHTKNKALTLIDLTSSDLREYPYPLSIAPHYIQVSPLGETVAVYDKDQQVLEVHAIKRKKVLLRATAISGNASFTFSPDGSEIYWVDRQGKLRVIDLWSNERSLQLSESDTGLSAMSRSADGTLGFISDRDRNAVHIISLRTFSVLKTVRVGKSPSRPWGTADGRLMLIPNSGDGSISAISIQSLSVAFTQIIGKKPISIHSGWLDTLAAVLTEDGDITIIDLEGGGIKETFSVNALPSQGLVTSDSKTLAVTTPGSGSLHFFDLRRQKKLGVLKGLPDDLAPPALAVSNNLCH